MKLSAHFSDTEFRCRHCGKLPDQAFGSVEQWIQTLTGPEIGKAWVVLTSTAREFELNLHQRKVSPDLLIKLETLREKVGQAIHISSGYRCPIHNKAIGGVSNSQHLFGKAADIVVKNMTPAEVKAAAEPIFGYKSGIGLYKGFLHLDVRQSHARW